jgi:hypothetical protein
MRAKSHKRSWIAVSSFILMVLILPREASAKISELSLSLLELRPGSQIPLFLKDQIMPVRRARLRARLDNDSGFYYTSELFGFMDRPDDKHRFGGQFRSIAWETASGWSPWPWLGLEIVHYSEHLLDKKFSYPSFDGIGIRLDIVK